MEASPHTPPGERAHAPGEDQLTGWEITAMGPASGTDMLLETEASTWLARNGLETWPDVFRAQFAMLKEAAAQAAELFDADATLKIELGGKALPGGERKLTFSIADY